MHVVIQRLARTLKQKGSTWKAFCLALGITKQGCQIAATGWLQCLSNLFKSRVTEHHYFVSAEEHLYMMNPRHQVLNAAALRL